MLVAFNFAPRDWMECAGQSLEIKNYSALFSILGTRFGGNGTSNFRLPDLRGRAPLHVNQSNPIGREGGVESVTLSIEQMAQHRHNFQAAAGGDLADADRPRGARPHQGAQARRLREHVLSPGGDAAARRQPGRSLLAQVAGGSECGTSLRVAISLCPFGPLRPPRKLGSSPPDRPRRATGAPAQRAGRNHRLHGIPLAGSAAPCIVIPDPIDFARNLPPAREFGESEGINRRLKIANDNEIRIA